MKRCTPSKRVDSLVQMSLTLTPELGGALFGELPGAVVVADVDHTGSVVERLCPIGVYEVETASGRRTCSTFGWRECASDVRCRTHALAYHGTLPSYKENRLSLEEPET